VILPVRANQQDICASRNPSSEKEMQTGRLVMPGLVLGMTKAIAEMV
jgi:hypothetical protein